MKRKVFIVISLLLIGSFVCALEPPPTNPPPPVELLEQFTPPPETPIDTSPGGSIGLLKYLPDGTQVEVAGKVVSGVISTGFPTVFYVQEPDRSAGIRVTTELSVSLSVGSVIDISGVLATTNGERVIEATTVSTPSLTASVEPLLISLADIGGGPAGYQPGAVLRVPTTEEPVGLKAVGINNIGLLVQIYGKVTAVGYDYFYVDDGSDVYLNADDTDHDRMDQNVGSDIWDGTTHDCSGQTCKNLGVMVRSIGLSNLPDKDAFVRVAGIVGARLDDQNQVLPLLQPRDAADVSSNPGTVAVSSVGQVEQETGAVHWNVPGLPLPIAPYPPTADTFISEGYLKIYSPLHQAAKELSLSDHIRPGAGYWLRLKSPAAIAYTAVNDDADRWVSLPFSPRWNPFGFPLNHDLLWSDLKVTDGKRTVGLREAAKDLKWVSSRGTWWNPTIQSFRTIGIPGDLQFNTQTTETWHGYFMYARKPVALIVPGTTMPDTPRGSIAATVTDTSPSSNPLIGARVYCKYGSAVTGSGGIATIGGLPPGQYLLTACAQGYKSKSQIVDVTTGDPVEPTFALESQSGGIILWLTANPTRIVPNGTSTSTITAHVTDLEGAPLPDKSVTITTDMSTFQETGTNSVTGNTSDQGTLSCTLVSLTTPNTATITATCEGATARTYVEFASASSPALRIQSPGTGSTISGEFAITVAASDADGLYDLQVLVDGSSMGSLAETETTGIFEMWINSIYLANGAHTIQAVGRDVTNVPGYSQEVVIVTDNTLSELQMAPPEQYLDNPGSEPFLLVGHYTGTGTWHVEIRDASEVVIAEAHGTGPTVAFQWDARASAQGIYRLNMYETIGAGLLETVPDWFQYWLTVGYRWADALICGKTRGDPEWSRNAALQEMRATFDACRSWGMNCTVVLDPYWLTRTIAVGSSTRERIGLRDLLPSHSVFFYSTFGEITRFPTATITSFETVSDGFVYSLRNMPGLPAWLLNDKTYFVSDCGLENSGQYKVVMINACYSAYADDMAVAFGIDSDSNQELMDQTYVGWIFRYMATAPWSGSSLTEQFWSALAQGYTVEQAHFNACFWSTFMQCAFYRSFGYPDTTWLP